MWFEESNMYFCHVDNFAYGEINERSFSNPHPWWYTYVSVNWVIIGLGSISHVISSKTLPGQILIIVNWSIKEYSSNVYI